ncbi:MAG: Spy/CpxP family protein refolding chaperone [Verrucomicrobiota bacterium]
MKIVAALVLSGSIGVSSLFAAESPSTTPSTPALSTTPPARSAPGTVVRPGEGAASQRRESISEQERQKIRAASDKYREEQKALYEKLRAARGELERTVQGKTIDEQAIREKAAVIGQIEGDLAIIRAKQYHDLQAILPKGTNAFARPGSTNTAKRLQELRRRPAIAPSQGSSITPLEKK